MLFAGISLNSTFAVLSGRGVAWRGRRYGRESGVYAPGMRPIANMLEEAVSEPSIDNQEQYFAC
jgi:hypothetical protein